MFAAGARAPRERASVRGELEITLFGEGPRVMKHPGWQSQGYAGPRGRGE